RPLVSVGTLPGVPNDQCNRSADTRSSRRRGRDEPHSRAVVPIMPECTIRRASAALTNKHRRRNARGAPAASAWRMIAIDQGGGKRRGGDPRPLVRSRNRRATQWPLQGLQGRASAFFAPGRYTVPDAGTLFGCFPDASQVRFRVAVFSTNAHGIG